MHRWFFADEETFCKDSTPPTSSPCPTARTSSTSSVHETDWTFLVKFEWNVCSNETLAISGSCSSLGNWDVQSCVPLTRKQENPLLYSLTVSLPRKNAIRYRYLIVALTYSGKKVVRFWETHVDARVIDCDQVQVSDSLEYEDFGILHDKLKIERGWLNAFANLVQLKFYHAPFVFKTNYYDALLLHVKVTPIKLKGNQKCEKIGGASMLKFESSNENAPEVLDRTFAYCEVASLVDRDGTFGKQSKYGAPCGADNILMFHLSLDDMEHTAFLIDFYNYSAKSGADVPPHHVGYHYVLPQDLKNLEGTLQLVIMCATKHRPIGSANCEYLVVKPMPSHDFSLEKTFQRYWGAEHEPKCIGHRGCGKSFWMQRNILRENTIYSLSLAVEHGADMVEFDVQLTRDMIPILWHDFKLHVTKKKNIDPQECDIMYLPLTTKEIEGLKSSGSRVDKDDVEFPLSCFTLEQLRRVKVFEPPMEVTCDSYNKSNEPFQTLEQVFKDMDSKSGFLMDLKWPQALTHGTGAEVALPAYDKNQFVDAILRVVLQYAGKRCIILSSFDADICTLVRFKQNLYPMLFLILPYESEKRFVDPRSKLIATGIYFANAMELLGIHVNCSDLLARPEKVSNVHERHMCIFCWGILGRSVQTREFLKTIRVNGILYDRINHVLQPDDLKDIIFYIVPLEKSYKNVTE